MDSFYPLAMLFTTFACSLAILWSLRQNEKEFTIRLKPVLALISLLAYFYWRVFFTILPYQYAEGAYVGWMWIVLLIEVCAYFETYVLLLPKSRKVDRSKELDQLIADDPEYAPSVDLLIPTLNEPLAILERTLARALDIDYSNYSVFVLDDGNRTELRTLCEDMGVQYLSRAENTHAKAGNMNHALEFMNADIIAILDADFAAYNSFLQRGVPFFKDKKIAQVQTSQGFMNYDRIQVNSKRWGAIRDEQRLWFNSILPNRDAYDCATSCGSCSLVRRDALRAIGDKFPVDTVTEDYDLSLRFLELGLITRYLNEVHAVGLAAENMEGFLIQRKRWGAGNVRAGFLALKRVRGRAIAKVFLIFDWRSLISLPARSLMFLVPILYFWLDFVPLRVSSIMEVVAFHGCFLALTYYAERQLDETGNDGIVSSQATSTLVAIGFSFSLVAHALKFKKLSFEVTPKGGLAYRRKVNGLVILLNLLITGTVSGGFYMCFIGVTTGTLDTNPIVSLFWGIWNVVVLCRAREFSLEKTQLRGTDRYSPVIGIEVTVSSENSALKYIDGGVSLIDVSEDGFSVDGDFRPGNYIVNFPGVDDCFCCELVSSGRDQKTVSTFKIFHDTLSRRAMHRLLYCGRFYLP